MSLPNLTFLAIHFDSNTSDGYVNYEDLLAKHKNLIDVTGGDYKEKLGSGATYFVSSGKINMAFNIKADQINKNDNLLSCEVYIDEYSRLPLNIKEKIDILKKGVSNKNLK